MMTPMKDITPAAPSGEALIRVYNGKLSLNAEAKRLLQLDNDSRVAFRVSTSDDKRLYVAKKKYSAYKLIPHGHGYRIHSCSLCRSIAEKLQGYGTYRIEAENPSRDINGDVCYPVFFHKYL